LYKKSSKFSIKTIIKNQLVFQKFKLDYFESGTQLHKSMLFTYKLFKSVWYENHTSLISKLNKIGICNSRFCSTYQRDHKLWNIKILIIIHSMFRLIAPRRLWSWHPHFMLSTSNQCQYFATQLQQFATPISDF